MSECVADQCIKFVRVEGGKVGALLDWHWKSVRGQKETRTSALSQGGARRLKSGLTRHQNPGSLLEVRKLRR